MQGKLETSMGNIAIDAEVIATYAGSVAVECFGIVGMAQLNAADGIMHLLKKNHLNRGIKVTIDEEGLLNIDFHVIVSYGVSIAAVADNLIDTVKYKVSEFTGMKVNTMNVYVEGVRVID